MLTSLPPQYVPVVRNPALRFNPHRAFKGIKLCGWIVRLSDVRYHPNDCGDYHGNRTHKHKQGHEQE